MSIVENLHSVHLEETFTVNTHVHTCMHACMQYKFQYYFTIYSQLDHGTNFNLSDGCNFCTCFHGDLLCTQHSCIEAAVKDLGPTPLLSCDCPTFLAPVCTMSGRTLPNSCFAKYVSKLKKLTITIIDL